MYQYCSQYYNSLNKTTFSSGKSKTYVQTLHTNEEIITNMTDILSPQLHLLAGLND